MTPRCAHCGQSAVLKLDGRYLCINHFNEGPR